MLSFGKKGLSMLKAWGRWTGKQREEMDRQLNELIAQGLWAKYPDKCTWCNQTEGKLMWHSENYDHPTKYLIGLCWRCHMILHSAHFAPLEVVKYKAEIAEGKMYPPVYRHDFAILKRDHNIGR